MKRLNFRVHSYSRQSWTDNRLCWSKWIAPLLPIIGILGCATISRGAWTIVRVNHDKGQFGRAYELGLYKEFQVILPRTLAGLNEQSFEPNWAVAFETDTNTDPNAKVEWKFVSRQSQRLFPYILTPLRGTIKVPGDNPMVFTIRTYGDMHSIKGDDAVRNIRSGNCEEASLIVQEVLELDKLAPTEELPNGVTVPCVLTDRSEVTQLRHGFLKRLYDAAGAPEARQNNNIGEKKIQLRGLRETCLYNLVELAGYEAQSASEAVLVATPDAALVELRRRSLRDAMKRLGQSASEWHDYAINKVSNGGGGLLVLRENRVGAVVNDLDVYRGNASARTYFSNTLGTLWETLTRESIQRELDRRIGEGLPSSLSQEKIAVLNRRREILDTDVADLKFTDVEYLIDAIYLLYL